MAYKNDIPKPTDKPSVSQGDLLNNFAAIKTTFDVNHETFDIADQGKHKKIDLTDASSSIPTGTLPELLLYNALNSDSSRQEVYLDRDGTAVPITARSTAPSGWTYLPSGILFKWGTSSANGDTSLTVSHGPKFKSVITAFITQWDTSSGDVDGVVRLRNVALAGAAPNDATLTTYGSKRTTTGAAGTNVNFRYLIIGT